jgi:hypothetical protein
MKICNFICIIGYMLLVTYFIPIFSKNTKMIISIIAIIIFIVAIVLESYE